MLLPKERSFSGVNTGGKPFPFPLRQCLGELALPGSLPGIARPQQGTAGSGWSASVPTRWVTVSPSNSKAGCFRTGHILPEMFFFAVCSNPNVPAVMVRYRCRGVAGNCVDQTGDGREVRRAVGAGFLHECTELCGLFRGDRKCHYR